MFSDIPARPAKQREAPDSPRAQILRQILLGGFLRGSVFSRGFAVIARGGLAIARKIQFQSGISRLGCLRGLRQP
jgi:hypothetical protein